MIKYLILFSIFYNFQANAFVTNCITYDVDHTHPDEIRADMFVKCMRVGSTIYLDGGVDENLIDELRIYNEEPVKTIYLNSGGGKVADAFELAHFIRENNIKTIVRKDALCASACTLLFQAGTTRIAHSSARFMYHSARFPFIQHSEKEMVKQCLDMPDEACLAYIEKRKQSLIDTTNELFDLYEKYGARSDFSEHYFSLEKDPNWLSSGNYIGIIDWWIKPKQLIAYNIVQKLIENRRLL